MRSHSVLIALAILASIAVFAGCTSNNAQQSTGSGDGTSVGGNVTVMPNCGASSSGTGNTTGNSTGNTSTSGTTSVGCNSKGNTSTNTTMTPSPTPTH